MREFQGKLKLRDILYSKVTVGILGILVLFFANATWGLYKKSAESAARAAEARAEYEKLEQRERTLKAQVSRLETEEGLEEEIRSKYSVSKQGEQVIIIVNKNDGADAQPAEPEGWWGRFKKLFR